MFSHVHIITTAPQFTYIHSSLDAFNNTDVTDLVFVQEMITVKFTHVTSRCDWHQMMKMYSHITTAARN